MTFLYSILILSLLFIFCSSDEFNICFINTNDCVRVQEKLKNYTIELSNRLKRNNFQTFQGLYTNNSNLCLVTCKRSSCSVSEFIRGRYPSGALHSFPLLDELVLEKNFRLTYTHGFAKKNRQVINNADKTLLIFTTCNQLRMTVLSLKKLLNSIPKSFDLVIIDDHSNDGTPDYLTRRGYFVVTKDYPKGLTDSWNIGYNLGVVSGYGKIVFANNDALVPKGALDIISDQLSNYALVVPVTTLQGSGHNPKQSFQLLYEKNISSDYINNPRNVDAIQNILNKLYNELQNSADACVLSSFNQKLKFNGFFFGVNNQLIAPAAFDHPLYLFDPQNLMVGQENELMVRMKIQNIFPMISKYSFIYHFKSTTVSVAKRREVNSSLSVENQMGMQPNLYLSQNGIDARENLSLFHPESKNNTPRTHQANMIELYNAIPCVLSYPRPVQKIVVGMVVSNPLSSPSAGDVYTALELCTSLKNLYSNVECRLLHRGTDWYDPCVLLEVDILVVLLDAFDLPRAQSSTTMTCDGLKPSAIAIAWARNWLSRWFSLPFIGNYDYVLVSSKIAKDSFHSQFESLMLPTVCSKNCMSSLSMFGTIDIASSNREQYFRTMLNIDVLRIATNHNRFSPFNRTLNNQSSNYSTDFVFTGSFHKQFRHIMHFDPSHVGFKGKLWGFGWESANLSRGWGNIFEGSIRYSALPGVYQSSKLVLDDANHATKPWGSVNSRVFDALSTGALVLTNGYWGSMEVFEGLLPVYRNADELKKLIEHFSLFEQERLRLTGALQRLVLKNHTYNVRAEQFSSLISKFGFKFYPREKEIDQPYSNSSIYSLQMEFTSAKGKRDFNETSIQPAIASVCLGIRTFDFQFPSVELLVKSLLFQHCNSKWNSKIALYIYLVNTNNMTDSKENINLVEKLNVEAETILRHHEMHSIIAHDIPLQIGKVYLVYDEYRHKRKNSNNFYGYDDTDLLLSFLLDQKKFHSNDCDWIMITNGDNFYNNAWFDSIAEHVLDPNSDLLGWDFVTHHLRPHFSERLMNGTKGLSYTGQQPIQIAIQRGKVDLGSIMARKKLYSCDRLNSNFNKRNPCIIKFMPQSFITKDMFARDFFTIEKLAHNARNGSIRLIHRTLMLHQ